MNAQRCTRKPFGVLGVKIFKRKDKEHMSNIYIYIWPEKIVIVLNIDISPLIKYFYCKLWYRIVLNHPRICVELKFWYYSFKKFEATPANVPRIMITVAAREKSHPPPRSWAANSRTACIDWYRSDLSVSVRIESNRGDSPTVKNDQPVRSLLTFRSPKLINFPPLRDGRPLSPQVAGLISPLFRIPL